MPHNGLLTTGILIGFMGLVLEVVAVATTGWLDAEYGPDFGLFNYCSDGDCNSIPSPSSSLLAVRGLIIIGIIGPSVGLGLSIVFALSQNSSNLMTQIFKMSCLCFVFGGIIVQIGNIVFRVDAVHKLRYLIGHLSYSFYLSIAGGIFSKVGGFLIVRGGRIAETVNGIHLQTMAKA